MSCSRSIEEKECRWQPKGCASKKIIRARPDVAIARQCESAIRVPRARRALSGMGMDGRAGSSGTRWRGDAVDCVRGVASESERLVVKLHLLCQMPIEPERIMGLSKVKVVPTSRAVSVKL